MAVGRMVETVMQVTGDIVQSISTFNDTLSELNKVAHRVNALLDEIEGPVAEIVPLVQASVKQAKSTLKKVDGVIDQVGTLPADISQAVATLGDLAGRLGPLAQFAEVAGGMFGMKPASNLFWLCWRDLLLSNKRKFNNSSRKFAATYIDGDGVSYFVRRIYERQSDSVFKNGREVTTRDDTDDFAV
jgi:hypothetical protein